MTRSEMLAKLKSLPFNVLEPDPDWEDIGFTESVIWIDGSGYGYYYCDQGNTYYKATRISDEKWKKIREKLSAGTLLWEDIKDTTLSQMCYFEDLEEDGEFTCDVMEKLLDLPEVMGDYYYSGVIHHEICFFNTLEEMVTAVKEEHESDCIPWEDMSDDLLSCWIDRLCNGEYDQGFNHLEIV